MIESVKPDPSFMPIPKDCALVSDPKRKRITAEQCAMAVNWLARDDGDRNLTVFSTTGVKGSPGNEWVEASSAYSGGMYRFAFYYRGGQITNCFLMTTHKEAEFNISLDGGNPFSDVTIEDRKTLTAMLVPDTREKSMVEAIPAWIICVGGARPYSSIIYWTKEEADDAVIEQLEHYKKYSSKSQAALKEAQSTEKEKAKQQNTIAFKSKKTGLKKK